MPETLSDKGLELLELLPPFLRDDPVVQGAEDSAAREFDRIQDAMDTLVANFAANTAEDYLHFWEELLGLTIQPEGLTIEVRRARVLAFLRRLKQSQAGTTWQERLTELIGSSWVHVEDDPDGLRGIYRDDFREGLDEDWSWDIGDGGDFLEDAGDATVATNGEYQGYLGAVMDNQFADLGFVRGTDDDSTVGVVLKRIDDENLLTCDYYSGDIRIRKKVSGSWTTLSSTAFAAAADTEYWIRGTVISDDVEVSIFAEDPIQRRAAAATDSHALAGGDIALFGGGVEGTVGLYVDNAEVGWKLRGFRSGEAGYVIDDYTVRIVLPFGGPSEAGVVETLARDITPANLELEVLYDSDFVLGEGELGTDIF